MSPAALSATWSVGQFSDDDSVVLVRWRSDIVVPDLSRLYPWQFVVTWSFRDVQSNGLPGPVEAQEAQALEDLLTPALEAEAASVLALVSTGSGHREWFFYCSEPKALEARLNTVLSAMPPYPLALHTGHDPEWEVFFDNVLPFLTGAA